MNVPSTLRNTSTTEPTHHRPAFGASLAAALMALAAVGALLGAAPASAAPGRGTAWVRAAHLVPGLGTMAIGLTPFAGAAAGTASRPGVAPAPTVDGMRAVAPAATYGRASEYRQVPVGLYTVTVRPAGASASSPALITGTFEAKADQAYTLAALGTMSSPRVQALADDLRPPTDGAAKVRLLPAASSVATVTVAAVNGPTLATRATFGRPTGYAEVPAGPWTLTATGTGDRRGASQGTTTSSASVRLTGGDVYTLLVLDKPSGGLALTPLLDAAGMSAMPTAGVQTGGGGTAPAGPGALPGLLLAACGLLVLAGSSVRRRAVTTR